jgi:DNA (cytosine-5)-methyltransferase 1
MREPTVISLFSGAMGLDLGLEAAGFRTAVTVEINPFAVRTMQENKPNLPVIHRGIEETSTQEILQKAGLKIGQATLVVGGPCCQSFSTAGKRQSISDERRGSLFKHFTRVVAEAKPRFFIMENVKGILSAAVRHRPLKQRGAGFSPLAQEEELGSALKVICAELDKLGYHTIYKLINCADYGVPQKRNRVLFIGSRDGEDIKFPEPSHSKNGKNGKKWISLRQALAPLKNKVPEYIPFAEERAKYLALLKEGQYWTSLPEKMHEAALGGAYDSWGGRCGFCRRLAWDDPSPTLVTTPTARATTLCHPEELRPLSIQEYARLQGFPAKWKFSGNLQQRYCQIGNAVPVKIGEVIGKMILNVMERPKSKREKAKIPGGVKCADEHLEKWLQNRPKTQLEPMEFRKIKDPLATREWFASCACNK